MSAKRIRRNFVVPINQPTGGEFSFRNGSSLIQIQMAASPVGLITDSVRLNYKLRLNKPGSTLLVPAFPNNNQNIAADAAYELLLDSRVGADCVIDVVNWSSGATNSSLESIRQYGRLLAITNPLTKSKNKMDGEVQGGNLPVASRQKVSGNMVNTENSISVPIKCGLLEGIEGGVLPLGINGVNGLSLGITLQNDSMALKSSQGDANDCYFSLLDVNLTYDVIEYDDATTQDLNKPKTGVMEFLSYSTLYSVINSSDDQQNFNPSTSKTQSIFTSSVPATHLNNFAENSFSTGNLKNINTGTGKYSDNVLLNRVSFIRNGTLSPLEYQIETETSSLETTARPVLISLLKEVFSSRDEETKENMISPNTQFSQQTSVNPATGKEVFSLKTTVSTEAQNEPVVAYGVNFDPISNQGQNFAGNNSYGLRLETTLNGSSPNALTTFVKSLNVLQYSPQGIQVSN